MGIKDPHPVPMVEPLTLVHSSADYHNQSYPTEALQISLRWVYTPILKNQRHSSTFLLCNRLNDDGVMRLRGLSIVRLLIAQSLMCSLVDAMAN